MKVLFAVAWLSCLGVLACVAATQRIHLTERSPLSAPDEFAVRRGFRLPPGGRETLAYELGSESFELYRPDSGEHRGDKTGLRLLPLRPLVGFTLVCLGTDVSASASAVRDVHRAYTGDGFAAARLLEVPDLGHALPSAEWFERALVALLSERSPGPAGGGGETQ